MPTQTYPPGTVLMRPMMDDLARNWGFIFLRGLAAIVFGVLTFAWPGLTLVSLVLLYGVFAIFDGVFAIGAAIRGGQAAPRWWLALLGVLGLAAGVVTLAWPGLTGLLLLYFIAGWAIVSGVLQIIGAIRLRKEIEGEWLLIASGVLSVLFGVFVVANPGAGALGLAFAIGTFAVIYGVLLIGFALRLRSHARVRI
jgi:uncharacterized membrane protein HdeD (DUF308 family)